MTRAHRTTRRSPRNTPTSYGVSEDGDRGTRRAAVLEDLAYLDSLWMWSGTGERVADHDKMPPRLWAILARDVHNTWRVREVRANTAEQAAAKYNNIFNYEVVGVGLLGGSGHAIQWMRDGEWNV